MLSFKHRPPNLRCSEDVSVLFCDDFYDSIYDRSRSSIASPKPLRPARTPT